MNKSSNRHMNIFHAYTQSDTRPIENNISRGLAILLQEHPTLLMLLLNGIQKKAKFSGNQILPVPENEYYLDFQVEASNFDAPVSYLIGVTLTAAEIEDDDAEDSNSSTGKQITDISIRYDEVLIFIEVKRTSENCYNQVRNQMNRFKNSQKETFTDAQEELNECVVGLTWTEIYSLLQQYCRIKDNHSGRLVEDYMEYLALNYPSWVPVQRLNLLEPNQTEFIAVRLDTIKNEYANAYLSEDNGLLEARKAIPINNTYVKQCNIAYEQEFILPGNRKAECVTVGMWPSDTVGQFWKFKALNPTKNVFYRKRYTTIAVGGKTVPVRIRPYIKFSHFMGKGIQWLGMNPNNNDNHFDEWMNLACSITKKHKKGTPEWNALIEQIQIHQNLFDDKELKSFVSCFHQNFANRGYVFVSCGLEIKAYYLYKDAQALDKEAGAFAKELNQIIEQLQVEMEKTSKILVSQRQ